MQEDTKLLQEKDFTMEELSLAVKQLASQKCPGMNGLPTEFFKMFWLRIGKVLYEAILEMYAQKQLLQDLKTGVINLIPKQDKDSRYLKNLRPITLLNTEYKIIEKLVANRLVIPMSSLIHHNQCGFMKNRRLASVVRRILDLMVYTKENNIEGLILALDFEKCFDKIEHSAIIGSMRYFNFAEYLITWTDLLYSGFEAKVQNNGKFSNTIKIDRGCHQGGPA